ncbi:SpoIIE family protein phosphatase [Streptomyces tsukubensis]|uniref:Serine/threonine protein phosphatase n=1 Tax=Streptomyces tsukubensis TaxID=83656 RepID=A0A1V4A810_9ACTN|nr:hypothetical protein B1H18_17785 [Streptomyces tsukubensis]QFR98217.1 SpoIIE family protein phosphatase [Streptomyces tsukubensis]
MSAAADIGMERFARLVSSSLRVPFAAVSLAAVGMRILPGLAGLPEPWAGRRSAPRTAAPFRHVVSGHAGGPEAGADAFFPGLGVVSYAAMPVTDASGRILGSLCAMDTEPHDWSAVELRDLCDLAQACSSEIQLRIVSRHARLAQGQAEQARHEAEAEGESAERERAAAERARGAAQSYGRQARLAQDHAELLLRVSEELTPSAGVEDVRRRLRDLFAATLKPCYVGLSLVEDSTLRRVADPERPYAPEEGDEAVYAQSSDLPSARALRERRVVSVPDRETLVAEYSADAVAAGDSLGLRAAVCLPLAGTRGQIGVLVLGWDSDHPVDVQERAVLTSISGYVAQAVERAVFLDERITVARQLQSAMLTELPDTPGLDSAALYLPAAAADMVGGDWYDIFHLPDPPTAFAVPPEPPSSGVAGAHSPDPVDSPSRSSLAVTVGDITGHDMHAATIMGQVRSMLRQAVFDHPGQGPAVALTALERACATLPITASGTLVHARLRDTGGFWRLVWSNAGHPPPLLLAPDGEVVRLDRHGVMLHPGLGLVPRPEEVRDLAPGSVLLLYTDGLVERPGDDIDDSIDRAAATLRTHAGRPLAELLQTLVAEIAGPTAGDDIVLLALRIKEQKRL